MKVPLKGLTPLGTRTQAGQSFLDAVHASRRARVNLIDADQLTGTNRAKPWLPSLFQQPLKVVVLDVAEREDPAIAADLILWACLRERISKRRHQALILHSNNGNTMRTATLESRLEELGVLRSFSRPRVSNDNPYPESLFRKAKIRPDYPRRPLPARRRPASGWRRLSTGTTSGNAIAASNS